MSDWQSSHFRSGHSARSRPGGEGHVQINVEGGFDFDQEIEGLRHQVGRLKHVTREIHDEAQDQNKLLEQLKEMMEKGQHRLRLVKKKLDRVYEQSKSNHLLWLVLFVFCIIVAVWVLAKLAHVSRTLTGS